MAQTDPRLVEASDALARRFNLSRRGQLAVLAALMRSDIVYSTAPADALAERIGDWIILEGLLPPSVTPFDFRDAVRSTILAEREVQDASVQEIGVTSTGRTVGYHIGRVDSNGDRTLARADVTDERLAEALVSEGNNGAAIRGMSYRYVMRPVNDDDGSQHRLSVPIADEG
ncbi:hypothetical protein [Cupriavidus sp. WS]|uniref:hypothetical protein n=1 Tax=Cupriavidus sp. WS TaxID=1312922 RepID=UPI0012DF350D|nr:hypothetical protein [Cupriavidus sp. WS]